MRVHGVRRVAEVLAVSVLGGAVVWCGARWEDLGPLIGVGYVILLLPSVIERWHALLLGFLPGFLGFAFVINLTLDQFAWYVPLMTVPLFGGHYVVMAILARTLSLSARWPAFVVIPLAMGAEEWLRPIVGFGHYNMYGAGTFLFRWPVLIQAADLIGALGLTVLWALALSILAEALRWKLDGTGPAGRRRVLWSGVLGGVSLAFLLAYGTWSLSRDTSIPGPRVAIVQPSMDHSPSETPRVVQVQQQLTIRYVPRDSVDLIAWPENAILTPYESSTSYQDTVSWLAASRNAPLVFGTQAFGPDGRRPTASAFLVDVAGKLIGRYDKVVLFPFTEGRPFPFLQELFPGFGRQVQKLTVRAWGSAPNGWPGTKATVLTFERAGRIWSFWPPLCYDSCYARLGREAALGGARFFVNLTSEGWNGWGLSNNQLAVNTLRAVENRVGLVRVGNTGVSAFIRPDGCVDKYLYGFKYGRKRLDKGVLIRSVVLDSRSPTVYSRWGAVLDALWPLVWLGAMAYALARRWFPGR